MRQHTELARQAQIRQRLLDMRLPQSRAHQALAETVRLAQLEANVLHGTEHAGGCIGIAPHVADVLILGRQRTGGVRNALQRRHDPRAMTLNQALALPGRHARVELNRLVDHAQVVLIVQEAGVGADLGIDADPEVHVTIERRRLRKILIQHPRRRRRGGRRRRRSARERAGRRRDRRAARLVRGCRRGRGGRGCKGFQARRRRGRRR